MQLSRFDVKFRNNVYTREKLTYLVDVPAVLDATPFTTAGKQSEAPPVVYDLQGVVHHSGTAHAGHYVAFVRGADDAWCLHNDAKVTSATEADALTSGAYVLNYAKRRGAGVA
ncbi:unnamed protein product [Laminaria digitata]